MNISKRNSCGGLITPHECLESCVDLKVITSTDLINSNDLTGERCHRTSVVRDIGFSLIIFYHLICVAVGLLVLSLDFGTAKRWVGLNTGCIKFRD